MTLKPQAMLLVLENMAWREMVFQQLHIYKFWIYILGNRFNRKIIHIKIKEKDFSLCQSLSCYVGQRDNSFTVFPEPELRLVSSQDSGIFLEATQRAEHQNPKKSIYISNLSSGVPSPQLLVSEMLSFISSFFSCISP